MEEVFSALKFWRNRDPQVNEDSFDLAVTYPQCELDKVVTTKENKSSSIVINTSVGITRLDKDTSKQYVHQNLSKIDGRANAIALNANVLSLDKLQTNFKSRSPVLLVLRSSRVSMLRFKKSSSLEKAAEINCTTITSSMATPKREQSSSFKSKREKSEDSSSYKVFKLVKQASKMRIFDQPVSGDGEKRKGNGPAVFTQVCRSLMKSKSSVRTVPVPVPVCRRDDSALQQQDGIQSAILHCKRSYSSSSSSSSFSTISQGMSRCASESSHRKAAINPQNIISPAEREMK